MSRALFDTSVFVALEAGRTLGELPAEAAVSVVTIAELELGVLSAVDAATRAIRLGTLTGARDLAAPLPVDAAVASSYAALVAELRQSGRRAGVQDAWIAATARAHRVPVVTQDDGFSVFPGLEVIPV